MPGLKDKLAIVTGAAQGIGEIITITLAENSAQIILWDRDKKVESVGIICVYLAQTCYW
jgi:NADP-dependent 3-hydroxy acid dehydrogenase YdfG